MRKLNLINEFAKKGKIFTFEEGLSISGLSRKSLKDLLYRMEKQGYIERIEKGKYMIIPLGAEKGKYTLHEFIIGSLLVEPYSIAYWSALNFYGFTEQIPNIVFVQTTLRKKIREKEIFGVRYKITRVKDLKFFGNRKEWIEETQINITDREKTIVDCLDKPKYCGGIIEVAKGLKTEEFNNEKLSKYSKDIENSGVIRRLGYLSDFLNIKIDLPEVNTRNYLYLDPSMPKEGGKNAKWRLIINLDKKTLGELE